MESKNERRIVLAVAWAAVLSNALYKIIWQEAFDIPVSELRMYLVQISIALIGFALTFLWQVVKPLKPFFAVLLIFNIAFGLVYTQIDKLPFVQKWLNSSSFSVSLLSEKTLGLLIALIMILSLLIIKKKRQAFFLAIGDTKAEVEPVRWLGVKAGEKWNKFGWTMAVFLSLGTLTFLVIVSKPSWNVLVKTLPFVPIVLLVSAINAFYEEVSYKASFASVLVDVVGKPQTLLLTAAFFGIWHYYGIPYGLIGVLLAGFLGWLLTKSMIETKGLFWAWFLHFLQDVFIFGFMAIGSVTPGGR